MLRPIAEIGNSLKVGLTSTIDKLRAGTRDGRCEALQRLGVVPLRRCTPE